MAFYSGFFNSKGLDRTYTAEDFTSYLSSIICNGILDTYGQMFKLTAESSGLKVNLGTGKAWINGHYFINDARYSIDLSSYQDESLPRYVGICIYLDTTEAVRSVTLKLFPGTPAESPQLPSIPQDADHVRLLMYAVRLNPSAESLTERDWYDYREDRNVCGYCRCILGKCKVTDMLAQLAQIEADIQGYNDTIAELTNKVDTLQTEVDDIIGGIVEIGSCGENIHYVLYENGKLLLHG
ncbi:MAG: leucine-rich repeat domain-containing protein, partial [Oscillospiraceae bacterium]|nr:leucine-rich repeat domain-containing protein [Oscillospiraceae bacterium]